MSSILEISIKELLRLGEAVAIKDQNNKQQEEEKEYKVKGWVRLFQKHKNISFIHLSDGSGLEDLQIVYKGDLGFENLSIGSSLETIGNLKKSDGKEQDWEFLAREIKILKEATELPIQKNKHSLEFLRENAHVRHRTFTFHIVNKIKNQVFQSVHRFLDQEEFSWIQAPIITENNCEGGANIFSIEDSEEYFNKRALLSVSGQFHAEALALGLGRVYSFGPTFRSEKSNTSRHLSEFWMIEPEISFWDLEKLIEFIEKFVKYVIKETLEKCRSGLEALEKKIEDNSGLLKRLESVVNSEFKKIEYRDALEILKEKYPGIKDGDDLAAEQEKYICEKFGVPVFVMNYPKKIKAFYMKNTNIDPKVGEERKVKSVDLLVEGVGELVGGSERASDIEELESNFKEFGISEVGLEWYKELRNQGYYKSSGFGIGFERLVCYITGLKNIKDAINFPRTYRQLRY